MSNKQNKQNKQSILNLACDISAKKDEIKSLQNEILGIEYTLVQALIEANMFDMFKIDYTRLRRELGVN